MIKKLYKVCAILLMGFIGGCITPWFSHWFGVATVLPADAVSIANTYIVFTTIIFVGITVVLGIVGYVFTQQLAVSKKNHEFQVFQDLRQKVLEDEKIGVQLADAILDNSDVIRHLNKILSSKLDELVVQRMEESSAAATRVAQERKAMSDIASQLTNGGSEK